MSIDVRGCVEKSDNHLAFMYVPPRCILYIKERVPKYTRAAGRVNLYPSISTCHSLSCIR